MLSLADEQIPIRELMRLSGKSEAEVYEACFDLENKLLLETGRQSWDGFTQQSKKLLGLEIPDARFREIYDSWHYGPNTALFGLIDRLSISYRIGVCSNTGPTHWALQRDRPPYFNQFGPVILSYEAGVMKPHRGIYDALADRAGVPHERILFTDDSIPNVEGARAAGLHSVHFTDAAQFERDLTSFGIKT